MHPSITQFILIICCIAATIAVRREGVPVRTKILLPTCFGESEISRVMPLVKEGIAEVCAQSINSEDFQEFCKSLDIGVTIAVPRACLLSEKIVKASGAAFMTIDMDDLTELTFGMDKSHAEKYMVSNQIAFYLNTISQYMMLLIQSVYMDNHIIPRDPFSCLDEKGTRVFVQTAIERAREFNNKLTV